MRVGFAEFLRRTAERGRMPVPKKSGYKPLEAFSEHVNRVVPAMEEGVEVSFLREQLAHIEEGPAREEVIKGYLRRKAMLRAYDPPYRPEYKETKLGEDEAPFEAKDPVLPLQIT
jgi:hypothetical protein